MRGFLLRTRGAERHIDDCSYVQRGEEDVQGERGLVAVMVFGFGSIDRMTYLNISIRGVTAYNPFRGPL